MEGLVEAKLGERAIQFKELSASAYHSIRQTGQISRYRRVDGKQAT
jgi:hypothetical protein